LEIREFMMNRGLQLSEFGTYAISGLKMPFVRFWAP